MKTSAKDADRKRLAKQKKPPKKSKKKIEVRKVARTVQETLPYERVCGSYIIEVKKGYYSKTYSFSDICFTAADDEEQTRIILAYGDLLNSFDWTDHIQITLHNNVINKKEFEQKIMLPHQNDGFDEYRDEYNSMLLDKMEQGQNGITTKKYLTLTVEAIDLENAKQKFAARELFMRTCFQKLQSELTPLRSNQRVRILADIFRGANLELRPCSAEEFKRGAEKSLCCPDYFEFKKDYFLFNDKFARMIYLKQYPATIHTSLLTELCELPFPTVITLNIKPVDPAEAIKMVNHKLTSMRSDKMKMERKAGDRGVYGDVINDGHRQSLDDAAVLLNDLMSQNQKMFQFNHVVMVTGNSFEELESNIEKVEAIFRQHVCTPARADFQQEDAMAVCLPLGNYDRLPVRRTQITESASAFMPFNSKELSQDGGFYYGLNSISNNLVIFDRCSLSNANGFILGSSGSGKSFAAKREIVNAILGTNDVIIIIDPEREYTTLTENFKGEVIYISENSQSHLNPLEISLSEYEEGEDVISAKYNFFLSFFETIMGGTGRISPEQKTIIDNCLHEVYRDFLMGKSTEMPTLRDYYDVLCRQTSEDGKTLAMSLELYVNGSMRAFSHKSNVDVNNRIVTYDIKDLGKQLKPLGMMVVLENLWDAIVKNRARGIRTRIYIDEIYLLFQSEQSSNFLFELYKRARKWGGVPTGITQNVEDLLKSDTARTMLSNSEFILMLNQAASDREQLARLLKIPDTMMNFVTGAKAGSGLIHCGQQNGSLPFCDDFPTDTKLYKMMTTKFGE